MVKNIFVLLLGFFISQVLLSQLPGSIDNSFGNNGIVVTDIDSNTDYGKVLVIQSDEKIILTGDSYNGSNLDFALVRYNTDGTLDNSFGNNGIVITDINGLDDEIRDAIIQSEGKIIALGTSYVGSDKDIAMIRYHTDGSIDSTFGSNGIVTAAIGSFHDYGNSIAIQTDDKIIVAGSTFIGSYNNFFVARFNSDGSLDNTFGTNGIVTTSIGSTHNNCNQVKIQDDGKIIVIGSFENPSPEIDLAVVRYNTDGTLDNSFGNNGIFYNDTLTINSALFLDILSNNKLFIAGRYGQSYSFIRLEPNGTLDLSYGSNGISVTDITSINITLMNDIAVQPDGKYVLAGTSFNGSDNDILLIRNNIDGSLDTSFGSNGIVLTDNNEYESAKSVIIQNDGKIVAGGETHNGISYDFIISRYHGLNTTVPKHLNRTNCMLYPNPANAELRVKVSTEAVCSIEIFNNIGEKVLQSTTKGKETAINISNLPAGIYHIKLASQNLNFAGKFVKE